MSEISPQELKVRPVIGVRVSSRMASSPTTASQRCMPGLAITTSTKRVMTATTRSGPRPPTAAPMSASVRSARPHTMSTSSVSREPIQR